MRGFNRQTTQAQAVIDDVEHLARTAAELVSWLEQAGLGEVAAPVAGAIVQLANDLKPVTLAA